MTTTPPLSPADLELLEFERAWFKYLGRKEALVRERFGTSLTRHTQRVLALIEHPAAVAYDAQLVNRLRDHQARLARIRSKGTAIAAMGARR